MNSKLFSKFTHAPAPNQYRFGTVRGFLPAGRQTLCTVSQEAHRHSCRRSFSFAIIFLFLGVSSGFADKIFLKNGRNYEGKLMGRSEKRFLFSVHMDDEIFPLSFFPEDVERIELSKDTAEEQIPYLKEVEPVHVTVAEKQKPKVYELTLYKESQGTSVPSLFTETELKKLLNTEELEYYERFNAILKRYADKFSAIQNIYLNLTTATKEDFAGSQQDMDELYFELNNLFVPEAFKKSHTAYLESVKASFLTFSALDAGRLEEASHQMKVSEEAKQKAMEEFRQVILNRKQQAPSTPAPAKASPVIHETDNS